MTLVSRNIKRMQIFGGSFERGRQMTVFSDLDDYFFGNFRYKASNIIMAICRPLSACKWLQN